MNITNTLEIQNVLTEKDVDTLQKTYDTLNIKSYKEYIDWVVIQALKAHILKENDYNQEKADTIKIDSNSINSDNFLISYDVGFLRCILTIKFTYENKTITLQ